MLDHDLMVFLKAECERKKIALDMVLAIMEVESSFNPKVLRYEKNFKYFTTPENFAKKLGITVETEINCQKTSYGLMQLMGGTARELKFQGYLTDLLNPAVNIIWGTDFLQKLCRTYLRDPDRVAAYNAGSVRKKPDGSYENQEYVSKILKIMGRNSLGIS